MPETELKKKLNNDKLSGNKRISLFLRVHIMPTLNRPLSGNPWYWIAPFMAAGILIIALVYFLGS
jgi:hypothetical protein